jgi:hypothetical protein
MDCFVARAPRNDGGMGESEILPGEIHSNDGFNDIRPTIHRTLGLTFVITNVISSPPGTSGLLAFALDWKNDGIGTIERRPR